MGYFTLIIVYCVGAVFLKWSGETLYIMFIQLGVSAAFMMAQKHQSNDIAVNEIKTNTINPTVEAVLHKEPQNTPLSMDIAFDGLEIDLENVRQRQYDEAEESIVTVTPVY